MGSRLKTASRSCKAAYRSWVRAGRLWNPDNPSRIVYKSAKKAFRAHLHLLRKKTTKYSSTLLPPIPTPVNSSNLSGIILIHPATNCITVDNASIRNIIFLMEVPLSRPERGQTETRPGRRQTRVNTSQNWELRMSC